MASFKVVDSYGFTVASRYGAGTLEFVVGANETYHVVLTGTYYGDAQYRLDYDKTLSLPVNPFSNTDYVLWSFQDNLTLTGSGNINGTGNAFDNTITGNRGDNHLNGLDGSDWLDGGAGDDWLFGGNGVDVLDGGSGGDRMAGGAGSDIYAVESLSDVIVERSGQGRDVVIAQISYALPDHVEDLALLGADAQRGTGNGLANEIEGTSAANKLWGLGGNDRLYGYGGNDVLDGGTGSDRMDGGKGNDLYVVNTTGDVVSEQAQGGTDTVKASVTWRLGSHLENLTLTGSSNLTGIGNEAANKIVGNAGNNRLSGGSGNDVISGGGGNDVISGGLGTDALRGNAGADRFVFASTTEAGRGSTRDVIRDFAHRVDHIDLSAMDAKTDVSGNQVFRFIGSNGFSDRAGELRYASGIVSGDVDGDGRADFQIGIGNHATLTQADFIL